MAVSDKVWENPISKVGFQYRDMRGKERGGEVWGGSGRNGEPFLTLYPPDLIPLPGHSYIHLVMTSP